MAFGLLHQLQIEINNYEIHIDALNANHEK